MLPSTTDESTVTTSMLKLVVPLSCFCRLPSGGVLCLPLGFPTALPSGLFLKKTLTPLGGPTGGPTGGWRLSMGGPTGGWGLSDGRANGRVATLRWEAQRESRRKHHASGSIRTAGIQVQLGVNTTSTTTTTSTTHTHTHTRNSSVPHWQLAAESTP